MSWVKTLNLINILISWPSCCYMLLCLDNMILILATAPWWAYLGPKLCTKIFLHIKHRVLLAFDCGDAHMIVKLSCLQPWNYINPFSQSKTADKDYHLYLSPIICVLISNVKWMWSQQTKINILLMLLMAWCWLASWEYRSNMETFSALQALCAGNSPVIGEIPAQRRVTRSFDVFFDLRLNKHLSKQSWGWWFETPSRPLWRHCNDLVWEHDTADSFYRKISNIRRTLVEKKLSITQMKSEHRLSALLQLHLHSRLDFWPQGILQREPQENTRIF